MNALTLVASLLLSQAHYTEDEAKQIFVEANDAYANGEYARAVDGYQKLLAHGRGGGDVLFNLGTTHLAQGDIGRGVLFLERAKRAAPDDEDVDANLGLARGRQLDKVVGVSAERPFLDRIVEATDADAAATAFLLSWAGGCLLLALHRFLSPGRRGGVGLAASVLLAVSLPLGAVTLAHRYVQERQIEAVIIAPVQQVRELPRDSGKVSFEVHAGLKVRWVETSGTFVKVRLPNGLEGWTDGQGVERI